MTSQPSTCFFREFAGICLSACEWEIPACKLNPPPEPASVEMKTRGNCKRATRNFGHCVSVMRVATTCILFVMAIWTVAMPAAAQTDKMLGLAKRSAIVVQGRVTKVTASEEPLLSPTNATVVIKIERMYAGSEFAGDQTGHTATVILSRPDEMRVGTKAIFFGNPRFIGKTITIADIGETAAVTGALPESLARGLQARRDAPIRARLALAEMVFRGTVENVRPLESSEGKPRKSNSEHDPEWHLAMVRVTSGLRGVEKGRVVPVVFPASRDIIWFNSPKLRVGEDAVVIGHRPQEGEMVLLRGTGVLRFVEDQHAVLATEPFDVLPPREERRVNELLRSKEVQQ
jgi:hypothetical protein